jgi:hypothetical protein
MNTSFLLVKCEGSTKLDCKKRFSLSFPVLNFLYQLRAGSAFFLPSTFSNVHAEPFVMGLQAVPVKLAHLRAVASFHNAGHQATKPA